MLTENRAFHTAPMASTHFPTTVHSTLAHALKAVSTAPVGMRRRSVTAVATAGPSSPRGLGRRVPMVGISAFVWRHGRLVLAWGSAPLVKLGPRPSRPRLLIAAHAKKAVSCPSRGQPTRRGKEGVEEERGGGATRPRGSPSRSALLAPGPPPPCAVSWARRSHSTNLHLALP